MVDKNKTRDSLSTPAAVQTINSYFQPVNSTAMTEVGIKCQLV